MSIPKSPSTRGGRLLVSGTAPSPDYHKRCSHVACGAVDRYYGSGRNCQGYDKLQLVRRRCGHGSDEFFQFWLLGQIWFNRAYTYECAVEEMPAGYGDTLMSVSPAWAFPVVVTVGMILSVWIANISMKMHKAVEKS